MSLPTSVLVTGANRGLGLEFVRQFAAAGVNAIFATYRNAETAKELLQLAAENKAIRPLQFDVRDVVSAGPALVASVSSVVGDRGLNVLVNNAGVAMGNIGSREVTHEELMQTYEVNAVGPALLTQAFLPLLKLAAASGVGTPFTWTRSAVFNMSSGVGSIADASSGGMYSYRMSKAALNMCTKAMSVDLKGSGILVVSLNPGWVRTDMGGSRGAMSTEESIRKLIDVIKSMTETNTGGFVNHTGKDLPY